MAEEIETAKQDFLDVVMMADVWRSSIQRNPTYKDRSATARNRDAVASWRDALLELAGHYSETRSFDEYLCDVEQLRSTVNAEAEHKKTLTSPKYTADPGLRISHAQKSLSLVLKHRWCRGLIPRPPACPVDARILAFAEVGRGLRGWVHINSIDALEKRLQALQDAAGGVRRWRSGIRACSGESPSLHVMRQIASPTARRGIGPGGVVSMSSC